MFCTSLVVDAPKGSKFILDQNKVMPDKRIGSKVNSGQKDKIFCSYVEQMTFFVFMQDR